MKVTLVKQLCEELPAGSTGTAMILSYHDGKLPEHGMIRVQWDNGMNIPMYRNEIKELL